MSSAREQIRAAQLHGFGGDELDKGGEEPGNQVSKANVKNAEIGAGETRNQEKLWKFTV